MSAAPLLSFYGDDFTGSTDVMEALASNGVPTVLFTRPPTAEDRARFAEARAIGLAGESRSRSPDWMDAHLPRVFAWLKSLGARYCHYKVCSTFDSSPEIGSIGRATELGLAAFEQEVVNLVVGAPQLRRYTMFGQLFAAYQDAAYRIDRHPVMSRHPSTPMTEADLTRHLAAQCGLRIGAVTPDALRDATPIEALRRRRAAGDQAMLIDVYDAASQERAGALLEADRDVSGPFVVGSSGVEYALLSAWRAAGLIGASIETPPLTRQRAIAAVSGSCSATTERQIRAALAAGFESVAVDYAALAGGQGVETALSDAVERASAALREGRSPLVYTALGPGSVSGASLGGDAAGRALGEALRRLLDAFPLERVAVAGGDTSSHALSALDIVALTLRRPIPATPGSPVCTAYSARGGETLEISLKGGQIGPDDYFVWLRDGDHAAASRS